MRSVVTGGFHLIVGAHDHEQLFNLRADPAERHDLLRQPDGARAPVAGAPSGLSTGAR